MSQETRPFRNSNLFSNHYIEKQVRESPEWRETNAAEAMAEIGEIYRRKARTLENYNEAQLEENFIRPVLRAWATTSACRAQSLGRESALTMQSSPTRRA
jgi:hypothetical protein